MAFPLGCLSIPAATLAGYTTTMRPRYMVISFGNTLIVNSL